VTLVRDAEERRAEPTPAQQLIGIVGTEQIGEAREVAGRDEISRP
jgi:hypothetical protein